VWFNFICELKICVVTLCHFNEHWVISSIKILLALILHVGVWSKGFVKIPYERNISLFQDNNKIKNKEKSIKRWVMHQWYMKVYCNKNTNVHFLDNGLSSMPLLVFCRLLVIAEDRVDYVVGTTIPHKLNLSFAYHLPDLILEIFIVFNWMA